MTNLHTGENFIFYLHLGGPTAVVDVTKRRSSVSAGGRTPVIMLVTNYFNVSALLSYLTYVYKKHTEALLIKSLHSKCNRVF